MKKARQRWQEAVEGRSHAAEAASKLQAQLASLTDQRDSAVAENQLLQGVPPGRLFCAVILQALVFTRPAPLKRFAKYSLYKQAHFA